MILEDLQKPDPVDPGHLVIRQDYIEAECFQDRESIFDGTRRRHDNIRPSFKTGFTNGEKRGIVINIQD